MIAANELRIGNALYDRHGNMVYIHNGFFCISGDMSHLKDYKPIPLTPEILEQCGFRKWDYEGYTFNEADMDYDIRLINDMFYRLVWDGKQDDYITFDTPFQYLHELQNKFYFATGAELKINIPATV